MLQTWLASRVQYWFRFLPPFYTTVFFVLAETKEVLFQSLLYLKSYICLFIYLCSADVQYHSYLP